ncbi:MAG: GEVED domain-containing protein [Phycisphaerales bacterium]|nr:GEVED domain-containing protein [Phycisphaerales bacterium]
MKKIFTFFKATALLLLVLWSPNLYAKISCTLNMTPFTRTFTYLATGTRVTDIEADEATKTIPIGFTFKMGECNGGTSHTNIQVSSNGWAKLLSPGTAATGGAIPDPGGSVAKASKKCFGPFWSNLSGVGGTATYLTEFLPSGLKVFTMEWRNWSWDPTASAPCMTFQLKLYEGSNIIEYCYKTESLSAITGSTPATVAIMDSSVPAVAASCYDFMIFTDISATPVIDKIGLWGPGLTTIPPDNQVYQFFQFCCDKPTAGIISQPDSVCVGAPFVARLSGATPVPFGTFGVQYLWQAAPSATGPWVDLGPKGSSITWSFPAGIYNDTFLRVIVECDSAKPSTMYDTTVVKRISLISLPYNCYCYSSATNDLNNVNIGNFKLITAGKDTLINNGLGTPAFLNKGLYRPYTLNTGMRPIKSINRDSTYDFSVMGVTRDTFAFTASGVALYIDYNNDGVYSASTELAAFQVLSGTTTNFVTNFTVPLGAALGTVGMRVIMRKGATSPSAIPPCGAYTEGETEDYLININYPKCPGPLTPGTAYISDTSICDGYTVTIFDTAHARNMSQMHWEWEYSLDNIIWANVPSSKFLDTIEPVVRQSTYYRLRMVCEVTSDTLYSNKVFIKLKAPYKCYCHSLANGKSLDSSDISTFTIGSFIYNTGGPHLKNPKSVRMRTDNTNLPAIELWSQVKYPISVYHTMLTGNHTDARISVFMDFNHNMKYDAPSELVWSKVTSLADYYPHDTILIPEAVIPNVETGMRIVLNNNLGISNPSDIGCDEFVSGEIEDYLVIFRRKSTNIAELTNVDNLQIYPNPNNGQFIVSFTASQTITDAQLIVTTITGQQVYAERFNNVSGGFNKSVSLNGQPSGVYLITLIADGQKSINKLMLQ